MTTEQAKCQKCPKCGADLARIHDNDNHDFKCDSVVRRQFGFTQSDYCRVAELTATVARLTAALAESESTLAHFRESYAEEVQEVDRLERELAEASSESAACLSFIRNEITWLDFRGDFERSEFKRVVAGHLEFLTAVEKWIEWCDGNGNPDDQAKLWANVKRSWKKYRTLNLGATDAR